MFSSIQNNIVLALLVSYQEFIGALEHIANKMAVPFFHRLPANEAKMIHVTNALEKNKDMLLWRIYLTV